MNRIRRILVLMILLKNVICDGSRKAVKFPDIKAFLASEVPDLNKIYEISKCKVHVLPGSCAYRVIPQRAHCLTLAKVVQSILPSYILSLSAEHIRDILPVTISIFYINTCLAKVTFVTSADGQLQVLPVLKLSGMVADISVPIPFGDYEMTARGTWTIEGKQMTVKITRSASGQTTLSGSTHHAISIRTLGRKFDVDILPSGGIKILLQNLGLENFRLRRLKVRGQINMADGNYELVFSGIPDLDIFEEAHVRVLVVKRGRYKNMAILLELPDYSPVTLLKRMFGTTVNRITLLRDRNQTLALFVTSQPFTNFTQVLTAHGSSRWLHRDSKFAPGSTLLVTLPFPKRKALDMKIQIFADGLGFSLPDGENLPADLALTAISPIHITRIDRTEIRKSDDLSLDQQSEKFEKILILRFRYFILNDTYVAAAQQLNAMEEELKDLMPTPIIDNYSDKLGISSAVHDANALDMFFKRSERLSEKSDAKRNSDVNKKSTAPVMDKLSLAEKIGLLKRRRNI